MMMRPRARLRMRREHFRRIRAGSAILLTAGALVLLTPLAIRWYIDRQPDDPPMLLATPQGIQDLSARAPEPAGNGEPAQVQVPDSGTEQAPIVSAPPAPTTVTSSGGSAGNPASGSGAGTGSGTGSGAGQTGAPRQPAQSEPAHAKDTPAGVSEYAIEIPRLGASYPVVAGIGNLDLLKGPGHYPTTVKPGDKGNAAIAGHRTVRGKASFFYSLDKLRAGDQVRIVYPDRTLIFTVNRVFVTDPFDLGVLDPTPEPTLTLTTCDPPGLDTNRLIVQASLAEVKRP